MRSPFVVYCVSCRKMVRFRPKYVKDYFWQSRARNIISWIIELAVVIVLAFILTYTFGQRVNITDEAMESTLTVGDRALMNIATKAFKKIKRGDIIAFTTGGDSSQVEVRRVIGLPKETVLIRDGQIYINGEIYIEKRDLPPVADPGLAENEIVLGGTEYFVLGDSRNNSEDSRHVDVGNVTRDQILGTLWLKLDPIERLS